MKISMTVGKDGFDYFYWTRMGWGSCVGVREDDCFIFRNRNSYGSNFKKRLIKIFGTLIEV